MNKGNVKDQLSQEIIEKKEIGSVLSYANILAPSGKCLTTCRAISECMCTAINIDVVQSIMESNTDFEEKVCTNSVDYLVRIYAERAGPLAQFDERRLLDFFNLHAHYRRSNAHAKVVVCMCIIHRSNSPMEATSLRENVPPRMMMRGSLESFSTPIPNHDDRYVPPKQGEMLVTKPLLGLFFDLEIKALE